MRDGLVPCPDCGAPLAGRPERCAACGLVLVGDAAARLWAVDQSIAALYTERAELLRLLRGVPAAGAAGGFTGTAAPPAVAFAGAPFSQFPVYPPQRYRSGRPRVEWSRRRVQNLLLSLGVAPPHGCGAHLHRRELGHARRRRTRCGDGRRHPLGGGCGDGGRTACAARDCGVRGGPDRGAADRRRRRASACRARRRHRAGDVCGCCVGRDRGADCRVGTGSQASVRFGIAALLAAELVLPLADRYERHASGRCRVLFTGCRPSHSLPSASIP